MPSGDFARPQGGRKPVKVKPKRPAAMLDTLPAKKGAKPKPYTPPVAKKVVQKTQVARKERAGRDDKSDADRKRASDYLAKHPSPAPKKKGGGLLATAVNAASDIAPVAAAVAAPAITGTLAAVDKVTGAKSRKFVSKTISNTPKDAAEIAVTTPSNLAKLGSTAVHDPKKVPGMLAEPYKELVKHPGKFISEHPVSTALMVAPAAKMPGRALGKVARVTGKQTLERAPKTLPGTALKEARTKSRDAVVNAVQTKRDKGKPAPTMTDKDVQKRVDEFRDFSVQHKHRVTVAAGKQAKERTKGLPRAERKVKAQEHVEGARGGAERQLDRRFAEEFGSTWYVERPQTAITEHQMGRVVVKPKDATKGVLHKDKADADLIAERVPFDATVKEINGKYAVVPKVAADRLAKHKTVGTSPAIGAKVMRTAGKSFRNAVLPTSPRWLAGQATEAGFRSAVAGAGPTSYLRARRIVKQMNRDQKGSGTELLMRTGRGGQFDLTGTAREFAQGGRSLADEFSGTSFSKPASGATRAANTKAMQAVRKGWRGYSHVVFDVVNGAFEQTARTAMLGKAIKNSPLMERRIIGLSDKAISEAAQGLKATENQVAMGRAIDRMYGQYQKFSPEKRETLLHTTPFWPWYRNAAEFLLKVLPADHPVLTAVIASANVVYEDWRKANRLSLYGDHRPGFMLGGYPTNGGENILPLGRYIPFGAAQDPVQGAADLFLPQFAGIRDNLVGIDWTGKEIKGNRVLNALATGVETHVPGAAQAGRITGLTGRYVRKKDEPSVLQGKPILPALTREANPFRTIPDASASSSKASGVKVKVAPVKVRPVKIKPVKVR